jgi:hypothetical protein
VSCVDLAWNNPVMIYKPPVSEVGQVLTMHLDITLCIHYYILYFMAESNGNC